MAESSTQRPSRFVVRILTASGETVGVGVLVDQNKVMTCAHVVNRALGRDMDSQAQPEVTINIDFPILWVDSRATGRCEAQVDQWLPPPRQKVPGDDLAALSIVRGAVPAAAEPAHFAAKAPHAGQIVDIFGYPGIPPRPDGAWVEAAVRGDVGGGRMQLDSTTGAALRIQPGYSGSPVCDRATGAVLGILSAAPGAHTGERDSYAIAVEHLLSAWPTMWAATAPSSLHQRPSVGRPRDEVTVLHISDVQFGKNHIFGGNGLTPADQAYDTLFRRLHDDLLTLTETQDLKPDLMVVTGDLAEWGMPSEFEQVIDFLTALTDAIDIPRRHVAIVPGNHDINRAACKAYFANQEADQRQPLPPYWPKWRHFSAVFNQFYETVEGVSFTPDEPWTLFEMPDLAIVVAGLNSTMAESHLDNDHYGWLGEEQVRWFAERLTDYKHRGWLRLAAVHHNVVRGATLDDENLRDADDLDRWLGQPNLVNLLLHGHTHDSHLHRLDSGLLALSTGSAAVSPTARPQETPNQYQIITINPDSLTRYARQYSVAQRCWIGDTRISPRGADWHEVLNAPLVDVNNTFRDNDSLESQEKTSTVLRDVVQREDDFLDRVQEVSRAMAGG